MLQFLRYMRDYTPPFSVSARAISLVAEISALVERYAIRLEQSDGLLLRKANRIKTIHSSLAIEGNELTEGEVCTLLEGKSVVAPPPQLLEVRNAIRTYEESVKWDAFCLDDMLRAHACMMQGLCPNAGAFRSGGVGVFAGEKLVHMAPPAGLVPTLMHRLFDWLQHAEDHLLIRSCVFHYEFEFIHPFNDGNGRIGRLWQSLILGKLHPAFPHLPVENMVFSSQEGYYKVIEQSSARADCSPFIDFMLEGILHALRQVTASSAPLSEKEQFILHCIAQDATVAAGQMAERCGISPRQMEKYLAAMKQKGLLRREGARKNGRWQILLSPTGSSE